MAELTAQFNSERANLGKVIPLNSPYVIYVEISSFCNLECKFCPQHISPEHIVKKNMTMDTFTKMINDIGQFEVKPKLMRFCGLGDSLFNKQFIAMAKLAAESNVVEKLELITNGALLNEELIFELPKYLDRIIISIEGLNTEDYQEFTLRKVNFEELANKVKRLKGLKAKIHVKIHNSAVSTEERKELFFSTFQEYVDEIYIENLVDLWPEIQSNLGLNAGHRFDGGDLNNVKVCPQIFKSMQINSDGRVIPCCIDWKGINIIGDIEKSTVKEIWEGGTLKELRMKHLQGLRHTFSPCKGCTMNEYSDKDNLDLFAEEIIKNL